MLVTEYPSRSFPSLKTPKPPSLFSVQESLRVHTCCPLVLLLNYEATNQESYETQLKHILNDTSPLLLVYQTIFVHF